LINIINFREKDTLNLIVKTQKLFLIGQ